jgi:hypothetical protein
MLIVGIPTVLLVLLKPSAHGWFLALDEELADTADSEAGIRGLRRAADLQGVRVDHVLVCLGIALLVVNIPAKGLEKRVNELDPDFRLLVLRGLVRFALCVVAFKQARDVFRNSHFCLINLTPHYSGRRLDCETVPVRAFLAGLRTLPQDLR